MLVTTHVQVSLLDLTWLVADEMTGMISVTFCVMLDALYIKPFWTSNAIFFITVIHSCIGAACRKFLTVPLEAIHIASSDSGTLSSFIGRFTFQALGGLAGGEAPPSPPSPPTHTRAHARACAPRRYYPDMSSL